MKLHWRQICRGPVDADRLVWALGVRLPPVDVVAVADALGIEVYRMRPTASAAGLLEVRGGVARLYFRGGDPVDERATVAREIGRLLLEVGPRSIGGEAAPGEVEAWAQRLLMPEALLRWALAAAPGVDALPAAFWVTEAALLARLAGLVAPR